MNILVIDARVRGFNVFVASATKVNDGEGLPHRLVLRHGIELAALSEGFYDLPILVMGEYHAQSSAGFAEWKACPNYGYGQTCWDVQPVKVVGMGGIPMSPGSKNKSPGLGVCFEPIVGAIVAGPGTNVERLKTYGGSNCSTVSAALEGIRIRSRFEHNSVFVSTGQSDCLCAYRISRVKPMNSDPGDKPVVAEILEFPKEHQTKMFSSAGIMRAQIQHIAYIQVRGAVGEEKPTKEVIEAEMRVLAKNFVEESGGREKSRLISLFSVYGRGLKINLDLCAAVAQAIVDELPPEQEAAAEET